MRVNRSFGAANICRIEVSEVLKPRNKLHAPLQVMPGWDHGWNIRVVVKMDGEERTVCLDFPSVPAISGLNDPTLHTVAQKLAREFTFAVLPDRFGNATFQLRGPNYWHELQWDLRRLSEWFELQE